MVDGPTSRSSPTSILRVLDKPPRHRHEPQCHRPSRGPVETLVWEDVLSGEVRGRPLEDLVLHLQPALIAAELSEFLLLARAQARIIAAIIGVGLSHPVPQARLADRQLFRQRRDRLLAQTGQLDRSTAKLRRVRCRHGNILPGGRGHLRGGVRAGGSSSHHLCSAPIGMAILCASASSGGPPPSPTVSLAIATSPARKGRTAQPSGRARPAVPRDRQSISAHGQPFRRGTP
jgi:hypothetical protein